MGDYLAGKPLPWAENVHDTGESPLQPAVILVLPARLRATLDRQIIVVEGTVRRMINISDHGERPSTQSRQRQQQQYLWRKLTEALRDAIVIITRVYVDFRLERLKPQKTTPSLPLPPPPPYDYLRDLDLADRFFVVGRSALKPGNPVISCAAACTSATPSSALAT